MSTFKAVNFTRTNLDDLRGDLNAVLEKYGKQAGIEFNIGNISYNDHKADIKIEAMLPDDNEEFVTEEGRAYNVYAKMDGITIPLNAIVRSSSLGRVKMVGYKRRNRKYPYIVEQVSTGTRYKLDSKSINALSRV